jgi:hypothetical protein
MRSRERVVSTTSLFHVNSVRFRGRRRNDQENYVLIRVIHEFMLDAGSYFKSGTGGNFVLSSFRF